MDFDLIKDIFTKFTAGGDPKEILSGLVESYGKDDITKVITQLVGSDLLKDKDYAAEGISVDDLTEGGQKILEDVKSGNFSLDSIQDLAGDAIQDKAEGFLKGKLGGLFGK